MIGFLFSLLRFKSCYSLLQIPSTKKAGQISLVQTWALNTLFMGDLQGEMGRELQASAAVQFIFIALKKAAAPSYL